MDYRPVSNGGSDQNVTELDAFLQFLDVNVIVRGVNDLGACQDINYNKLDVHSVFHNII